MLVARFYMKTDSLFKVVGVKFANRDAGQIWGYFTLLRRKRETAFSVDIG